MAAILFTDVVDYSLLSNPHQKQVAQELNEVCSKYLLPAFRYQRRCANDTTVVAAMPTGDGVVICLQETPDIPNPGAFLLDLAFALQDWGRTITDELKGAQASAPPHRLARRRARADRGCESAAQLLRS